MDQAQSRNIPGGQKATLHWSDRSEVALAVSPDPEPIAGVSRGCVRLGVVQVARHDQIQVAVTIDVVGDDPSDR